MREWETEGEREGGGGREMKRERERVRQLRGNFSTRGQPVRRQTNSSVWRKNASWSNAKHKALRYCQWQTNPLHRGREWVKDGVTETMQRSSSENPALLSQTKDCAPTSGSWDRRYVCCTPYTFLNCGGMLQSSTLTASEQASWFYLTSVLVNLRMTPSVAT